MFGNSGKDAKKKTENVSRGSSSRSSSGGSSGAATGGVNTIDESTTIKGNLEAGGDIRIDGKLIGDLVCKAKLIIGVKGVIDGDVDCANAMVEGGFNGNLLVREMLTLKDTAKVTGSIRAKKMAVSAGCKISGECQVTGDSDPAALKKKPLAAPLNDPKGVPPVKAG